MHYLGIDIGSITTDGVVIDGEGRVAAQRVRATGPDMAEAARNVRDEILAAALAHPDSPVTVTGYGREAATFAGEAVTEIICHARGAHRLFPDARLVIDMGGQDTKAVVLDSGGWPVDFAMNDKCAAGTGRFLEVMAAALNVPLEESGARSLRSKNKISLSGTCTVFSESEVISLLAAGTPVEDILAALHRAVAQRVTAMVSSMRALDAAEGGVVVTGGVAQNEGVVAALGAALNHKINVPRNPQTVGAFGAALLARRRAER